MVSPDPVYPTPSTSAVMMTPKNIDKDPHAPEPAAEGDIQIEYSSDQLCSPLRAVTKNYCKNLGQFDNLAPVWSHDATLKELYCRWIHDANSKKLYMHGNS